MNIYDNIRNEFLKARKNKQTEISKFLSFVLGTIQQKPPSTIENGNKSYNDDDTIKYLSELKRKIAESSGENKEEELTILDWFLPVQLSEEEIHAIFLTVPGGMKEKMSYLKTHYAGRYDGKIASSIAKEYI